MWSKQGNAQFSHFHLSPPPKKSYPACPPSKPRLKLPSSDAEANLLNKEIETLFRRKMLKAKKYTNPDHVKTNSSDCLRQLPKNDTLFKKKW